MAKILKGAPVATAIVENIGKRVEALKAKGCEPTLAIVRVGARSDDLAYERGATKRAEKCGIRVRVFELDEACAQSELEDTLDQIMADDTIHGCLLFRPLPRRFNEVAALAHIKPEKDVDSATQASLFGVFASRKVGFPPCTAEAALELLKHYGYTLEGANVTVIGRSLVMGRPVSMMLMERNATPTILHTRSRNIEAHTKGADIVVVAAGHAKTLVKDLVRPGQVVIDVGINFDEEDGHMVGDVDFDEVEPIVDAITPVPGGLGAVTSAILMRHVVEAAERMKTHE